MNETMMDEAIVNEQGVDKPAHIAHDWLDQEDSYRRIGTVRKGDEKGTGPGGIGKNLENKMRVKFYYFPGDDIDDDVDEDGFAGNGFVGDHYRASVTALTKRFRHYYQRNGLNIHELRMCSLLLLVILAFLEVMHQVSCVRIQAESR